MKIEPTLRVALQLHTFVQESEKKANARPVQSEFGQYSKTEAPPPPIVKTFQECLARLADDELAEFDCLIGKMFGAVQAGTS
jgi:hypothetical protein